MGYAEIITRSRLVIFIFLWSPSGCDDYRLAFRQAVYGVEGNDGALRRLKIAKLKGFIHNLLHTPPGNGNLSPKPDGGIYRKLYSVDIGGKGCYDYAPSFGILKKHIKGFADYALAWGASGAFGVCGIRKQGKNSLVAQFAKAGKVDNSAPCRGIVHLKVAGLDNRSGGGVYRKGAGIGNGVVYIDKFHAHNSGGNGFAGLYHGKACAAEKPLFRKLHFNKSHAEAGCKNRNIQLLEKIGHRTDMVLVTVGDKKTLYLVPVFLKVGKIRNNKVNSKHFVIGKSHSAIDDYHFVLVFINGHIQGI